ncbi:MAG: Rossmann-like and DUF2520 domain-containing protein [Mucilaginibacter sp.]
MRITIIGSGNVATHMAAAFRNAGHRIVQVYSRNIQHASLLAYHVGAEAIDSLVQIDPEIDIFVISVKDDAIGGLTKALARYEKTILHTSGATRLDVLLTYTDKAGVFYPLQTFSKTKELDFRTVPLCIEGADKSIERQLTELAQTVSNNVYKVDSEQRRVLHLAAVFACNFPNYLYSAAQHLLAASGMQFEMLRPLILETAEKVQTNLPEQVQTGPAVRNDEDTMQAHMHMLENEPELKQIYRLLSQEIIKNNNAEPRHG